MLTETIALHQARQDANRVPMLFIFSGSAKMAYENGIVVVRSEFY